MRNEEEIRDYLISNERDFRRMVEAHHSCESELQSLTSRGHVTDQEQLEEAKIKKKKLHLKDEISRRIQQFRHSAAR